MLSRLRLPKCQFAANKKYYRMIIEAAPTASNKSLKHNLCVMRDIAGSLPGMALRQSESTEIIDLLKAKKQHDMLAQSIASAGLRVVTLDTDDTMPDSVFIEDTAVAIDNIVLLTNMGAGERRLESSKVRDFMTGLTLNGIEVYEMANESPSGTLDGGDVLFTGREIFVGLSKRTNTEGVACLRKIFKNYPVISIDMKGLSSGCLHLKSACSMFGPNHIAVGDEFGAFIRNRIESFSSHRYNFVSLPDAAAANCVFVDNSLLIRRTVEEFPRCAEPFAAMERQLTEFSELNRRSSSYASLPSEPIRVVEVVADELAKVDGALTCCSILLKV